MGQRLRDWNKVDGEKQVVDSREQVKHIERNDQLSVMRIK